jgi:Glycosyl hydrolase catalytic core
VGRARSGHPSDIWRIATRSLAVLAAAAALVLIAGPAPADARVNIRVGIGDQQRGIFEQPYFRAAGFRRVRYFVPWNVMTNRGQRLAARWYVVRAQQTGHRVFLHLSSHDLRIKRAKLPSVRRYSSRVRRLVRYFRGLGVREFGTWNEANHASQPTYRSPRAAARYFRVMYRAVKGRCRSCTVVALDVLDQRGVERYMRRFYRSLSRRYRRRARVVGIHNYGDVNRRRTRFTRSIIRTARRYNRSSRFWFTETGAIVKFGRSFPCNTTRAANRLRHMFRLARRYRRSGVRRVYIYNWSGAGCGARFDAGLTTPHGVPRRGYWYLRRALRGYRR